MSHFRQLKLLCGGLTAIHVNVHSGNFLIVPVLVNRTTW